VPDIRRADPVGDEVNNIDEIPSLLFNPTFKANYFYSRNSKACYKKIIYLNLHHANKSVANLRPSGRLRSEATLGPSVCLSSTPVITRPVVCFMQTVVRL
jgi:hypothetical protein